MFRPEERDFTAEGSLSIAHETLTYHTQDGLDLFGQVWSPRGDEPRAVVCLVHGLGEHSARYEHLAEYLAERRYAVFAFDLRGHGHSTGARGDFSNLDALLSDIGLPITEAKRRYHRAPRFLYGHSLGGNLVLNYCLRRESQLAGVVASAPWLRLAFSPPAWKIALARTAAQLRPQFSMATHLDGDVMTHDEDTRAAARRDRFMHGRISVRAYLATVAAGQYALDHAAAFKLPLLVMQGSADRIVDPEASREFAEQVRADCTLLLWDGLYHDLHSEPEREEVFEAAFRWMEQRRPN